MQFNVPELTTGLSVGTDGEADYSEHDVKFRVFIQPAEPDVGIMNDYVDDVEVILVDKRAPTENERELFEEQLMRLEEEKGTVSDLLAELYDKQNGDYDAAMEAEMEQRRNGEW